MSKPNAREIFKRNLRKLIDQSGLSIPSVAKRAGISARALHYILDDDRSPTITTAEALANAFGFTASHLLMEEFDPDTIRNGSFNYLYRTYSEADRAGRDVMETAANYIAKHRNQE